MKLDHVLSIIGEFGPYQRIKFGLIFVAAIFSGLVALNMVFVGGKPAHHCKVPEGVLDFFANGSSEGSANNLTRKDILSMLLPRNEVDREKFDECLIYKNVTLTYANGTDPYITATYANTGLDNSTVNDGGDTNGKETERCSEWWYDDSVFGQTIVKEWDLVCDRKALRDTAKSTFFAGRLVGAVSFGFLSDIFGRRPVFLVALLVQIITGVAVSFSPNLVFFFVAYFLQGAMQVGVFLTIFVIGTELVGPSYRKLTSFMVQIAFSVGYMLLPLIGYYVRNWRYLELAISIPTVVFVSYYWFVPESVRWLLSHNRFAEAKVIIQEAADRNGVQLDETVLQKLQESTAEATTGGGDDKTVVKRSCLYLLSTPTMAFISFTLWFNWVVNSLVYYVLALNSENLGGSVYLNLFLQGAVEVPAYLMCVVLLDRTGRRALICSLMLFGGVTSGVVAFIPKDMTWLVVTLASLGKFGLTASYGIVYLFAAECFPTNTRNIGMGIASMASRIGGILSPYVLLLGELYPQAPMLLVGTLAIIGGLLCLLLPETANRQLPETVQEVEDLLKKTSLFRKCRPTSSSDDNTANVNSADGETDRV